MQKKIHIIGGGTVTPIRNHLSLTAEAYGSVAKKLAHLFEDQDPNMEVVLHLTQMAGGSEGLRTPEDVENLLKKLTDDATTKIIIMTAAMVDFTGSIDGIPSEFHADRLRSRGEERIHIDLEPRPKWLKNVREHRKDIFLVSFKSTTNRHQLDQYTQALHLLKESSSNLVFTNDVVTRRNFVVCPEESTYHMGVGDDAREEALHGLVEMVLLRSHLTFTRSTVVAGEAVPWDSPEVYPTLRTVMDYCIARGAYKPFRGVTVGHFAVKLSPNTFLTSIRKTNFNDIAKNGLVKVTTDGPDTVIAYGHKPSVGGQSQRIVFEEHPDCDCIVHFHCPMKEKSQVPIVSQREYECGSHQCGQNTSRGLQKFGNLYAVFLDNHGPNIVFNHDIDPQEVITFIENNFDLSGKTGGYVGTSTLGFFNVAGATTGRFSDGPNMANPGRSRMVKTKATPCCERDIDGDGNCDIHVEEEVWQNTQIPSQFAVKRYRHLDRLWVIDELQGRKVILDTWVQHFSFEGWRKLSTDEILASRRSYTEGIEAPKSAFTVENVPAETPSTSA